jgi:hypothetical protein
VQFKFHAGGKSAIRWVEKYMGKEMLSITGGARVGWINATWPLAKLIVQKNRIDLNATLIGKYSFTQEQVISIKKYTTIPILGWGIQIIHNISEYPKKIIFWSFSNPESVITKIQETGFLPSADPSKISPNIGIPVKWQAIVLIVALWNILLIADMGGFPQPGFKPGSFTLLALSLLFIGSISIWKSLWLHSMILKPGRSPSEIKAWLNLLALVSGLLFVIMSIINMIE